MNVIKLFMTLSVIAVILLGSLLVVTILAPEKEVVVVNQMMYDQNPLQYSYKHYDEYGQSTTSLEQKSLESNQKYYEIKQREEEDLRLLQKKTRNWNGEVDNIEYEGRDERIYGSERFHLYGEVDY